MLNMHRLLVIKKEKHSLGITLFNFEVNYHISIGFQCSFLKVNIKIHSTYNSTSRTCSNSAYSHCHTSIFPHTIFHSDLRRQFLAGAQYSHFTDEAKVQ